MAFTNIFRVIWYFDFDNPLPVRYTLSQAKLFTSAKEVMFSPGFVCEFVCAFVYKITQKLMDGF